MANAQFGVMALSGLALAYLHLGQTPQARAWIEEACKLEVPRSKYQVLALQALIALQEGNRAAARAGFSATLVETARILEASPRHGRALDAQAFARCGMLACGEGDLDGAVEAYANARAVNAESGVIARAVRLVDRLVALGPAGQLELARRAAGGA
jgi:tetratricopeptide (TPR) repeat protein